ncbi:MAG TPA: hypothetical protein VHV51_03080 [Polyangiaceae bacterium]|jgi:hypothetical protein|nr:hypothetical protein [Polyangiaceae bacterium]
MEPNADDSLVPPPEDYDENGVDRTLTRSFLKNTPLECLEALEDMLELAESVKRVGQPLLPTD